MAAGGLDQFFDHAAQTLTYRSATRRQGRSENST
jgi:hypothetical protein